MLTLDQGRLEALILSVFAEVPPLVPMPGGASTRRYFRCGNGTKSVVVMFIPDAAKADEIVKGETHGRWPFLEVRDLLDSRGIAVPKVLEEDTSAGLVLLEDLGDDTLANHLSAHPDRKVALYKEAVRALAAAQQSLAELPAGSVIATRAFDEDLLLWEIEHFREWGLEARGITLSADDRATFDGIARRLATRIASWPRGFVHRDYQSRNLMVQNGALVWIDFQDALMGPAVYDLVALLNDSYQTFDRAFVEERLDEYATHHGMSSEERRVVGERFDLMTVQRKLKDAGRFVFIDRKKQNPAFLPFVVPTIEKVKASLERLPHDPDMVTLLALLRRVLPAE